MPVGFSFTAELTDVRLVGPVAGSLPYILHEASVSTLIVPKEAASSEVHCDCDWVCGVWCVWLTGLMIF